MRLLISSNTAEYQGLGIIKSQSQPFLDQSQTQTLLHQHHGDTQQLLDKYPPLIGASPGMMAIHDSH